MSPRSNVLVRPVIPFQKACDPEKKKRSQQKYTNYQISSSSSSKSNLTSKTKHPKASCASDSIIFHHPLRCVECSGEHRAKDFTKHRDQTPSRSNCGGGQTANYDGCAYYIHVSSILNNIKSSPNINTPIPLDPSIQYSSYSLEYKIKDSGSRTTKLNQSLRVLDLHKTCWFISLHQAAVKIL